MEMSWQRTTVAKDALQYRVSQRRAIFPIASLCLNYLTADIRMTISSASRKQLKK